MVTVDHGRESGEGDLRGGLASSPNRRARERTTDRSFERGGGEGVLVDASPSAVRVSTVLKDRHVRC